MFPFPTEPIQAGSGTLISYISLRPGAGASTLACCHAMYVAEKQEVCLIDFNRNSKVRTYMGLTEDVSSASVVNINGVDSPQEIFRAGEKHHSNTFVIPGIIRLMDTSQMDAALHLKAASLLKKSFETSVAVLDTLSGPSWVTAMLSDAIYVVVTANRSDMDSFRDSMEFLSRLGCGERIKIILNQLGSAGEITEEGARKFFDPDIIIPYDSKIKRESNQRKLSPKKTMRNYFASLNIEPSSSRLDQYLIGSLAVRDGLMKEIINQPEENQEKELISKETYKVLRDYVQEIVKQEFSLEDMNPAKARNPVAREKFNTKVLYAIRELKISIPEPDIPAVSQKLFNAILGYGPLEEYFNDPDVTDIMVNGLKIKVEKQGQKIWDKDGFESIDQAVDLLRRMVSGRGKRIDRSSPSVKCSLHDGSRLMAHIEPATPNGIDTTIRRFRQDIDANKLIKSNAVSWQVMEFLKAAVKCRLNIVMAGGTSSGKTTWLNVLASFVDPELSIITIENPAELQLQHPDVRRLEAVDANIEGKGAYPMSLLTQDALKMRPDIIIVGEVVGPEAYYMIQAMNTGHPGSLCTLHSNSAEDGIGRLADMVAEGGENLPYHSVYNRIASAVDLIIFVEKDRWGQRRIDHICEVVGPKVENNQTAGVELNTLWRYKNRDWEWMPETFKYEERFAQEGWICPK